MSVAPPRTMERPAAAKRAARKATRRRERSSPFGPLLGFFGTRPGEVTLVALIFALAFAVRWPYLHTVPHYTDELVEVFHSAAIARGEKFPLTAKDLYFGPIHYYILAGFIRVFGLSAALPRLVILLFGVLAVGATYLLGRALAGRVVAALSAALLATSAQHIIVNSHVAWQNSTMPLYSTLCCLGFVSALNALRARSNTVAGAVIPSIGRGVVLPLIFAGFCFGLTLQTHPGAVIMIPALVATFLLALRAYRAWALLRSPWPYVAVGAALVAYSPPLIYNLTHGLPGFYRVVYKRDYAYEMNPTLASYLQNLRDLVYELIRMISDPTRLPAEPWGYLTSPYAMIATVAVLAGMVLLARRGQFLPLFLLVSTLAITPRYLNAYGPGSDYIMLFGRYVGFLLPFLYIAIATAAVAGIGAVLRRLPSGRGSWQRLVNAFAIPLSLVLIALLLLWPLRPLPGFYRETLKIDPNNLTYAATGAAVQGLYTARTPILIDTFLGNVFNKEGLTTLFAVRYYLDIAGIPYRMVDEPEEELNRLAPTLNPNDTEALPLVITLRDRCWPMRDRVPLQRVSDRFRLRDFYVGIPTYYAVYRYVPGQSTAGCFGPNGPQEGD